MKMSTFEIGSELMMITGPEPVFINLDNVTNLPTGEILVV